MFCRNNFNKQYCVNISPIMESLDIIKLVLDKLKYNINNSGIKSLYYYLSINFKNQFCIYNNFKIYLLNNFSILLNLDNYNIYKIKKNKNDTKCYYYIKIINSDKFTNFKISLSRQYDYLNNKPKYDSYIDKKLYLYWRIDNIEPYLVEQFSGSNDKNIFNKKLLQCGVNPVTGFYRNGYCNTDKNDYGTHTICSKMTDEFLNFTKKKGNDLITPHNNFKGLKVGDNWCLCALRWKEAFENNKAPKVFLNATNKKTLEYVNIENLNKYKI